MHQYRLGQKKGDGTFSEVFRAISLTTGQEVAIKCMKKQFQSLENVKRLPEIQVLKTLNPHDNVIKLIEVLYDEPSGKLALVFELMQQNLYECLMDRQNFSPQRMKYYMHGVLKALAYTHKKGIFHRDFKPENVLVSGDQVKLADFGSAKAMQSRLPYTEYISTRWYRAPECLMTEGYYGHKMDIWGYGCVLFEMVARYPLFNGRDELDQISKINKVIGTPSELLIGRFKQHASHMKPEDWNFQKHKGISFQRLLPHSDKNLWDLLTKLLAYDPEQRIEAEEALMHPYFCELNQAVRISGFQSTMVMTNRANPKPKKLAQEKVEQPKSKLDRSSPSMVKQSPKQERQFHASLPPIHNIKVDLSINILNQTASYKFKKTNWQTFGKKKL